MQRLIGWRVKTIKDVEKSNNGLPISKDSGWPGFVDSCNGEKCGGSIEANQNFENCWFWLPFFKDFWEQGLNAYMIFGYKYQAICSFEYPKNLRESQNWERNNSIVELLREWAIGEFVIERFFLSSVWEYWVYLGSGEWGFLL